MSTILPSLRIREFKFDGSVGYSGEKGKLDFNGVMHNIKMAQRRKFPEEEICYAAIRAIVPGHPTRSYLEGEDDLSVDKVIAAFRSHFQQQDVTQLYNEMTRCGQGSGEKDTAYTYIAGMFAKRNTINSICANKHIRGAKYDPDLVQSEMQKAISIGLTDADIRSDLRLLLKKDNLPDNELLAAVTESMTTKKAHDELLQQQAAIKAAATGSKKKQAAANVLTALTTDDDDDSTHTGKSRKNRGNQKDDFMAQLAMVVGCEIKQAVEPLQAQINELNQFRSSVQSQKFGGNQNPAPPAAPAALATPAADGMPCSDEFLGKLFRQVFENMSSSASSQQPVRSNECNGVALESKCSNCRAAGARFCNHCQICHGVDHRNLYCPKRKDPNFVPLN